VSLFMGQVMAQPVSWIYLSHNPCRPCSPHLRTFCDISLPIAMYLQPVHHHPVSTAALVSDSGVRPHASAHPIGLVSIAASQLSTHVVFATMGAPALTAPKAGSARAAPVGEG
jgi:hypothetical protein